MRSLWRFLWGAAAFGGIAACSGGGCSSCGMQPLAAGYPRDRAMDNAAAIRVTRPGIDFLAQNAPKLATSVLGGKPIINFDLPESVLGTSTLLGIFDVTPTICKGGPVGNPPNCRAEINIGGSTFKIDAVTPNAVRLQGVIPLRLSDTPTSVKISPGGTMNVHLGYGDGNCAGAIPNVNPHNLPVDISIPLIAEGTSPRTGYTKMDTDNADINLDGLNGDDVRICADCGGFGTPICNAILNWGVLKDFVVGQLRGGLEKQLKTALGGFTCTKANPTANPPCPDGSKPDNANLTLAKCVYTSTPDKCVPSLLGLDGHLELGSALKSISPGTEGAMDLVLASGGAMQPFPKSAPDNVGYQGHTPNGITLGMVGGALPSPKSNCVTPVEPATPTGIPMPDEMTKDKPDNWKDPVGPHVGLALAGRYLDFTFTNLYNSGFFCLGVTTEQVSQLQTGLVSVLAPSIKNLTLEKKPAPMAITTRPGSPPKLTLGGGTDVKTDPLITLKLEKFAVDFYVWSYDRFVRAFTFTSDITVPLNLQTGKSDKNPNGGLLPTLGALTVGNPKLSNNELLTEDPDRVAVALQELISGLVGQMLGGGIPAIDLSGALSSLGIDLTIPEGGIRKIRKDQDDFLAIFANFATAKPKPLKLTFGADILGKRVDASAMGLTTAKENTMPELVVKFTTDAPADLPVEFSYRIDQSLPSPWTQDRDLVIKKSDLFLQGRHTLKVSARYVGDAQSEGVMKEIPFVIDALAPHGKLDIDPKDSKFLVLDTWDYVSDTKNIKVRSKIGDAPFSAWKPVGEEEVRFPADPTLTVEVMDEEGNIGQAKSALVRGRSDSTLSTASGCGGCATPASNTSNTGLLIGGGVLLAALLVARRRGRAERATASGAFAELRYVAVSGASLLAVASSSQGCDCGSEDSRTMCGSDCNQPCLPGLGVGVTGAYSSLAKAKDGTIWVAGYSNFVADDVADVVYGDLVVGRYDSGKDGVAWEPVDGVPAQTEGVCPANDSKGWRKGQLDSGDNVGLWTSIQVGKDDHPMVSYYDVTHKTLKFAWNDGKEWKNHTITSGGDSGRYAKMIMDGGKPVIAFMRLEPGNQGKTRSKVVVARAKTDLPNAQGDWSLEDAYVDEDGPCTASSCGADVCVKSSRTCQKKVTGCAPECAAGSACVTVNSAPSCAALAVDGSDIYPLGQGLYTAFAKGASGLGIAVYDRVHGNLVGIRQSGGKWSNFILDGEAGKRGTDAKDTGDTGVGASLFIGGDDTWHVSYVKGKPRSYATSPRRTARCLASKTWTTARASTDAPSPVIVTSSATTRSSVSKVASSESPTKTQRPARSASRPVPSTATSTSGLSKRSPRPESPAAFSRSSSPATAASRTSGSRRTSRRAARSEA
ncbi:MAG: hypothetical protein U0174_20605 [Polyangiaceae bacterium]